MSEAKAESSKAFSGSVRTKRILPHTEIYGRIANALYEESLLLDEARFAEWSEFLAEDLSYTIPMRSSRHLNSMADSVVRTMKHMEEDYMSMMGRVGRLTKTSSAWAEDPPSRTRRLVTNILVDETDKAGEFEVTSYGLLTRSRFEEDTLFTLSYVRYDLLRDDGQRFKLASREIIIDQSVLGTPNLAIFL